ncbi:hypothetical protein [Acidovorax sp. Root219]|uniref:hypothetical protein n=1 Tax=Acidovorax sp. Root219 TaxID=1736493 RepID=UPI00070B2739|nr:hypothetical protein [Acidovorax sp. Root219]KRC36243.1 hypothetical protein ASE28_01530 [Acidovorax sp. Root219]
MAIIVPILLSYTGAAAGIAGAVGLTAAVGAAAATTIVSAAVSVAFQVSGVNNKINKAASKVFGEDLVMIANVAGAVYGAVNGGFDFGSGAEGAAGLTEAGGALSTKAMLDGTNAFGANSAAGAFDLADGVGALTTGDFSGTTDSLGNSTYSPGDMNSVELNSIGPAKGVNLLDSTAPVGTDTKAITAATNTSSTAQTGAAASDAAGAKASATQNVVTNQDATGTNAAGAKATTGQQLKAGDISKGVEPPKTTGSTPATKPGSFFDKLLSNDKAVGELIKGVGGGISGAANAKAEKDKLDWQKKRYTSTATTRIVQ